MASFTYTDVPGVVGTLVSDATKVTPAVSTAYVNAHSLVITPASDEIVEVTQLVDGVAANTAAQAATITMGRSYQDGANAEETAVDVGIANFGAASTAVTTDTYTNETETPVPPRAGSMGLPVTVRTKIKASSGVNVTSMAAKNATVTGRKTKRLVAGTAFRGAF